MKYVVTIESNFCMVLSELEVKLLFIVLKADHSQVSGKVHALECFLVGHGNQESRASTQAGSRGL